MHGASACVVKGSCQSQLRYRIAVVPSSVAVFSTVVESVTMCVFLTVEVSPPVNGSWCSTCCVRLQKGSEKVLCVCVLSLILTLLSCSSGSSVHEVVCLLTNRLKPWCNQESNQPTKQPSNQTTKQPNNQTTQQPSNQTTKQSINPSIHQSINSYVSHKHHLENLLERQVSPIAGVLDSIG